MSEFIKTVELAKEAGVHRITIWKWVAAGIIPAPIKLSRNTTVWNRFEILEWLRNKPRYVTKNNKAAENLITAA